MSVYWGKYVTVLITYMDNNFSNHLALKVGHEAMYLLYFRLLLVACTTGNPCLPAATLLEKMFSFPSNSY